MLCLKIRSLIFAQMLLIVASQSGATDQPHPASVPVARVNQVEIHRWEVEREMSEIIKMSSYHGSISDERRAEIERQAIDDLLLKEVKLQWAERTGLEIDPSAVDEAMARIRARFEDEESYRQAFIRQGIEEPDLRRAFLRDTAVKAVDTYTADQVAAPTEAEAEEFFDGHRDEYVRPESRHVVHVLFPVDPAADRSTWNLARLEAEEIASQVADGGGPLAELAAEQIDAAPDKYRHEVGDLGFVHKGSLLRELEQAAFALEPGQVSQPLRSIYGYHLVQVLVIKPPKPLEYSEVRDAVLQRMMTGRRVAAIETFETEQLAAAEIERLR
jgi:parvulin-like peptidyl-prolyl isomerase